MIHFILYNQKNKNKKRTTTPVLGRFWQRARRFWRTSSASRCRGVCVTRARAEQADGGVDLTFIHSAHPCTIAGSLELRLLRSMTSFTFALLFSSRFAELGRPRVSLRSSAVPLSGLAAFFLAERRAWVSSKEWVLCRGPFEWRNTSRAARDVIDECCSRKDPGLRAGRIVYVLWASSPESPPRIHVFISGIIHSAQREPSL